MIAHNMPESGESLFQLVCRHAELIKTREASLGAYYGDGPTAEQAAALTASLKPVSEAAESVTPSVLLNAFRSAVDTEMMWLFPEKDAIGEPMTGALREVQSIVGKLLEEAMPEQGPKLHQYVELCHAARDLAEPL